MGTYGGYAGTLLELDLSTRAAVSRPLPDAYRERLLGGKALAAQLLCDCMTGNETAFSEENPVVITAAPLTGTGAPGTGRFDLASLSPKDDLPAFSNCGGAFGLRLKQAGYDGLILRGKSEGLLWLEISDDGVFFHEVPQLQGMQTGLCRQWLAVHERAQNFASLCIGPAGENLVRFASVLADGHSSGRAGLGAVLGWKHVKAITVSGSRKIPLWAERAAWETIRAWNSALRQSAPEPTGDAYCRGCPLRCPRHGRETEPILDELGMDAIAAEAALQWAAEQGMETAGLYESIAFRQGIGDRLADGVERRIGNGKKRRNGSDRRIAEAFGLPPEEEATAEFCKNFTEAVSVCGQCLFTVNALRPDRKELFLAVLLEQITGQKVDPERLLALGAHSRRLEQQLRQRFHK